MWFALFFAFQIPSAIAADSYCQNLYQKIAGATERYVARVKSGGPVYILARDRTEAEFAQSYLHYFFPEVEKASPQAGAIAKSINLIKRAIAVPLRGKRYNLMPVTGIVDSVDRLFLKKYTARAPVKMAIASAANMAAYHYLIDQPLKSMTKDSELANAINYALDYEYSFRSLREELASGKISRKAAYQKVAIELANRRDYFELVAKMLSEDANASMESIAPKFLPLLNDPQLNVIFGDLRYFLSPSFRSNPQFIFRSDTPNEFSSEQFQRLFTLNHIKWFGFSSMQAWLLPSFNPDKLRQSDPSAFAIYQNFLQDPFDQKIIALQREGKITQEKMENLVMEDFEWKIRFSELAVLGANIKGPNSDGVLTLEDYRQHLLHENGIKF